MCRRGRTPPLADPARYKAAVAHARGGAPITIECLCVGGRALLWLSPNTSDAGVVEGLVAILEVERRPAETTEGRYRRLFDRNLAGVYRTSIDGRILDCNEEFARIFGYGSREEAIGQSALELYWDAADRSNLVAQARTRGSFSNVEVRFRRKDGSPVWVLKSELLVRDEHGEEVLEGIVSDVDERHHMQQRLQQSEHMASLGTLAAGVGHEINNPLAYVLSNLEYALEELPGGDMAEITAALREAKEGVQRIRTIVADLRTFAHADPDEGGAANIHGVLDASIGLLKNELRHRATVRKSFGQVPEVAGSESRLGQVFVNLLANAAHAIREGDVANNEVSVTTSFVDGLVVVEVRDTGAGIPPERLDRIFDPFFTTKSVGEGTGLGLAICHGIVSDLGGSITVRSAPGEGSTFRVSLPAARATTAPQKTTRPPPSSSARGRILVIDDEAPLARALARALRGHDVIGVTEGQEGLRRLLSDEHFDLVLCDLMMPDLCAPDLYAQLVERRPDRAERIVFITGEAFTPRSREFLRNTPRPCLKKPFDTATLRALVREQLGAPDDSHT